MKSNLTALAIQHTDDLVALLDATGRVISANDNWATKTGMPIDKIENQNISQLLCDSDRKFLTSILTQKAKTDAGLPAQFRLRLQKLNGEPILAKAKFVFQENGTILTIWQDVSEIMRIEKQFEYEKSRYMENRKLGKFGEWELNLVTKKIWFSKELLQILELETQTSTHESATFFKRVHSEDCERVIEIQSLASKIQSGFRTEFRWHCNSTKIKWILQHGQALLGADGTVIGIRGIAQDISEMRHTHDEIQRMSQLLVQSQEVARIASWSLDAETLEGISTDLFYELLEIKPNSRMNFRDYLERCHPDDRGQLLESLNHVLSGNEVFYEHRIRSETNEIKYVFLAAKPIHFKVDGKPKTIIGTIQDITWQKKLQEESIISQKKLMMALEVSEYAVWEWSQFRDIIRYEHVPTLFLGYEKSQLPSSKEKFLELVHPDDKAGLAKELESYLDKRNFQFEHEFRYRHFDGSYHWLKIIGNRLTDQFTGKIRTVGLLKDITQEALTSDHIQHVTELQRAIVDTAGLSVITTDPNGEVVSINVAAERLLGHSKDPEDHSLFFVDLIEPTELSSILSADLKEKMDDSRSIWNQLIDWSADIDHNEKLWKFVHKDGHTVIVALTSAPLLDSTGHINGFVLILNPAGLEAATSDRSVDANSQHPSNDSKADIEQLKTKILTYAKLAGLGEMAGGVAHEINNPLAVVLGKASQVKREAQKPAPDLSMIFDGAEKIEKMGNRISAVIKTLKNFARSADDDFMENSTLSVVMEQALTMCQIRFKNNGVELRVFSNEDTSIECRPIQISQAILNVLFFLFDVVKSESHKWVQIETLSQTDYVDIVLTCGGTINSLASDEKTDVPNALSVANEIVSRHLGLLVVGPHEPHVKYVIRLPRKQQQKVAA